MVRHIFLYKVAQGADPKEIVRILDELPKRLKMIRTWTLGKHQGPPGASGERSEIPLHALAANTKARSDVASRALLRSAVPDARLRTRPTSTDATGERASGLGPGGDWSAA